MTTDVRVLRESEARGAQDLFSAALQMPPMSEERWEVWKETVEPGRLWGAFHDDVLAGTTKSFPAVLRVPGGAGVTGAAVTAVGVRADRTRRGVLSALMRAQLADVRERGEQVAMLHASEAAIYGRFGFGVASRCRGVKLTTATAWWREDAPRGGTTRVVERAEAEKVFPEVYRRLEVTRPGMMERGDEWWRVIFEYMHEPSKFAGFVVHTGEDGTDDGFAWYKIARGAPAEGGVRTAEVVDLVAGDAVASAELWRFVTGLDLVAEVVAYDRPLDEPVHWWLRDSRQVRTVDVYDDLWVRLVDVRAALQARTYGGDAPVVVQVRDDVLPENAGTYLIGRDGVQLSEREPQLVMGVESLGALYLGDVPVSTLVAANRVEVRDPQVVALADAVFTTARVPWCGTGF